MSLRVLYSEYKSFIQIDIFYLSVVYLFINNVFWRTNILSLDEVQFINFFFVLCFLCPSKEVFIYPKVTKMFGHVFFYNFIYKVLHLALWSALSSFLYMLGGRGSTYCFACRHLVAPVPFVENPVLFSLLVVLAFLSTIGWLCAYGFVSGHSVLLMDFLTPHSID